MNHCTEVTSIGPVLFVVLWTFACTTVARSTPPPAYVGSFTVAGITTVGTAQIYASGKNE